MSFRFAQRRTIWLPTFLGWASMAAVFAAIFSYWWFHAESLLSPTHRLPAEVLVVEGWIGLDGIDAAGAEFREGGYRYIATASGMIDDRWRIHRLSYAEGAGRELVRIGIPPDRIIVAPPPETENQRTFQSAVAVWRALQAKGIRTKALNVFTMGPHARRSRLIFAKVNSPGTEVGVISWTPTDYNIYPWWHSSARAQDVIKETTGYAYEMLFSSGRHSSSPLDGESSDPTSPR
jgi:hypothetical protein